MTSLDVLMPFRAATPHRQAIHDWAWGRWERLLSQRSDVRVIVAGDDQDGDLFSPAKAVNAAFRQSTAPIVIIEGSGHVPHTGEHIDWMLASLEQRPWLSAYAGHRELTQESTMRLLAGEDLDPLKLPAGRQTPFAIGIMAMRREVFVDVGGMDERFNGWGYEDTALRDLLTKLHGESPQPQGILTTLWHPPSTRRNLRHNRDLYRQQRNAIAGKPVRARRYLERRGSFL